MSEQQFMVNGVVVGAPSAIDRIIDEGSKGNPDAKWYEFGFSSACPIPLPEHPTTRRVVLGGLAIGTALALWCNSARLPSLDAGREGSPVPTLKK
jgi:hypothetical protein